MEVRFNNNEISSFSSRKKIHNIKNFINEYNNKQKMHINNWILIKIQLFKYKFTLTFLLYTMLVQIRFLTDNLVRIHLLIG